MSEYGSVIISCVWMSTTYELCVACGYFSKIEKKWLDVDIKQQNHGGHQLLVYVDMKEWNE